ncbi:MAG TPA: glycosyltransferase [Aliidongia sp.]|nr:glycosyltransferase [Aliidongia sp.]
MSVDAITTPPLSVVMPVLNAARMIDEALASAAEFVDCEIIVVDGGSTDGTPDLVRRHRQARLISAPGTSIYQALNIAILDTRAPLIAWLNADDLLLPGAAQAAVAAFEAAPDADIVRGQAQFVASDEAGWGGHDRLSEQRTAGPLRLDLVTRGPLAVNTMFFRRSLFDNVGLFDESLRLAADREWMLRAWLAGIEIREIPDPVYRYRIHAGSSTLDPRRRNYRVVRAEHDAILRRYLPVALRRRPDDPFRRELRRWHAVEYALRLNGLIGNGALWPVVRLVGAGVRTLRSARMPPAA